METKSIYIIVLHAGEYEDRYTRIIEAYDEESDANREVSILNEGVGVLKGLDLALDKMMDEWRDKNPAPEYHSSTQCEQYEQWQNARCEEEERLCKVMGIAEMAEKVGVDLHDIGCAFYQVTKTELK
jgi:hypothetical protein